MNREKLRFDFLRNALYHTARRRRLEGLSRFSNFIVLVLGTAAAADVLGRWGISQGILGFAVAVVASLQFAFDWGGRARTHEYLQRRNYETLAEIEANLELDETQCADYQRRISLLSAEEPPTYRALDALAYNEALDALLGASAADQRLCVPWYWHAPLANLIHFNGTNFRSLRERDSSRATGVMARLFRKRPSDPI